MLADIDERYPPLMSAAPSNRPQEVRIIPVTTIGSVDHRTDLAIAVDQGVKDAGVDLEETDIIVVSHKIVSKSEDRLRDLSKVTPGHTALEMAQSTGRDARLLELILQESEKVLRATAHVVIVQTRLGHIVANAGIDRSNTGTTEEDRYILLPEDPDRSARGIRDALQDLTGVAPGVIVSDSFGRPWRLGSTGVAIGVAGPPALLDLRGRTDLDGKTLETSEVAFADSVAAAAVLVMGETDEACPVAVVRGLRWASGSQDSRAVLRHEQSDLFR